MRADFVLEMWVQIHLRRLMPQVWKSDQTTESLLRRYEKIKTILWGDNPEEDNLQRKNTREKFLGPDLIAFLPERYDELDLQFEAGYSEWLKMSLEERGEYIAFRRIKNMIEFSREYIRFNENLRKEELAKKKKK